MRLGRTNKVFHRNVEGLVPLKDNGGKFITVQKNVLGTRNISEVIESLNISTRLPFTVNACAKNFLIPYGLTTMDDTLTIHPMTVKDSDGNKIEVLNSIVKTVNGLFEEGNNKGCKDDSYEKWKQPIMNAERTPLGRCYQASGTMISYPYYMMDGILNTDNNSWVASTNSNWVFTSVNPFIMDSMILINTKVSHRTRYINIYTSENSSNLLINNYFCSPDADAQNYINIPSKDRVESNTINIETLSTFSGEEVGFNEIIINAKTRYVQQDSSYKVFVIANDDQSKIDVMVSCNDEPILPEGFTRYAYVEDIQTKQESKNLVVSYGNDLGFDDYTYPVTLTNHKYESYVCQNRIKPIKFKDIKLKSIVKHTVYMSLYGNAYTRTQEYYKNASEFPENPVKGDVVALTKYADIEAYEFDGEKWVEFNDIPVGEVYRYNKKSLYIYQYPCNNNFYIKSVDNKVWISEHLFTPTSVFAIPHDLNITNVSDYKCDCIMVCVKANAGYLPGEMVAETYLLPTLTKDYIELTMTPERMMVRHKTSGETVTIGENCFKLVFRIWR